MDAAEYLKQYRARREHRLLAEAQRRFEAERPLPVAIAHPIRVPSASSGSRLGALGGPVSCRTHEPMASVATGSYDSAGCSQPFSRRDSSACCSSSGTSQMKMIAQSALRGSLQRQMNAGAARVGQRNGCAGLLHDCVTAGLRRGSRSGRPADTRSRYACGRSASFLLLGKDPRKHVALSVAPFGERGGDRLDRSHATSAADPLELVQEDHDGGRFHAPASCNSGARAEISRFPRGRPQRACVEALPAVGALSPSRRIVGDRPEPCSRHPPSPRRERRPGGKRRVRAPSRDARRAVELRSRRRIVTAVAAPRLRKSD